MSDVDLIEAVSVLRDEVLDTVEHGDRDPPGAEVFEALLRALSMAASRFRASICSSMTRSRAASPGAIPKRSCSPMPRWCSTA